MTFGKAAGWILGVTALVIVVVVGVKVYNKTNTNITDDIAAGVEKLLKKQVLGQKYKPYEWREDAEPKYVSRVPCVANGLRGFRGVGHDGKSGCVHDD